MYRVFIELWKHIQVEVLENEKCFFEFFQNFTSVYNSIETQRTCFIFLLENTATRKRETTSLL